MITRNLSAALFLISLSATTAFAQLIPFGFWKKNLPPDPTSPSATAVSSTQINVTWTSGGGSTSSFKVAYLSGATSPANCSSGTIFNTASSPAGITGLSASTQYSFRICAVDAQGAQSLGVTTTATTQAAGCGAGQYLNGGTCQFVGSGFYSPANDNLRYPCTIGTNGAASNFQASVDAHKAVVGLSQGCWSCAAGFYWDGSACVTDACHGRTGPVSHAGFTWYKSDGNESCDSVCAANGLSTDLAGTRDYTGSGGSFANCIAVYNALGCPSRNAAFDGPDDGPGSAMGCYTYHGDDSRRILRRYTGVTDGATNPLGGVTAGRICACS